MDNIRGSKPAIIRDSEGNPIGVRDALVDVWFGLWPIYFWFVRKKNKKKLIPVSLINMQYFKFEVGDILVSGHNDLEYVGNGFMLLVSKERSTKLSLGVRIERHLKFGVKNQFIIRKGIIIRGK